MRNFKKYLGSFGTIGKDCSEKKKILTTKTKTEVSKVFSVVKTSTKLATNPSQHTKANSNENGHHPILYQYEKKKPAKILINF